MEPSLSRWHLHADCDELHKNVADAILFRARECVRRKGLFHLVTAGGRSFVPVYDILGKANEDWGSWRIYLGDERWVPKHSPQSNAEVIWTHWLTPAGVNLATVLFPALNCSAETSLLNYDLALSQLAEFDLVLFGFGADGHVASLFPGRYIGEETTAPNVIWVDDAPTPPPRRLTMTARRLSASRAAICVVTDRQKADALRRWRAGEYTPASAIRPRESVDVYVISDLY